MKKLYSLFIIFSLFYNVNLFAQEELIDGEQDTEVVDEGFINQADDEVENSQANSNQDSSSSSGVEVEGGAARQYQPLTIARAYSVM